MKKLLFLFLAVLLLAAKDDPDTKIPKPRFPLGKETTYVTEPLGGGENGVSSEKMVENGVSSFFLENGRK